MEILQERIKFERKNSLLLLIPFGLLLTLLNLLLLL